MQVTVEKVGPCLAKVSLSVPGDEFEEQVVKGLQHAGRHMKMKGFRPGKIPPQVVEKHYGDAVRKDTTEHFMRQAYQKAIDEHELKPIGFNRPDKEKLELQKGAGFEHEFEVSLRPDFVLGEYTGLEVESQLEPVLDQEVEAALEDVKRQQSRPEKTEPGESGGLEETGMVLCRLVWTHDGEEILVRDGLRLGPLTPPPGVDPEGFKNAMLDITAGETFEQELTIPEDFEKEDLRGKSGICTIEISEVYRMIAPTDKELQEMFTVDSPEALLAEIKNRIGTNKQQHEDMRIEEECVKKLCENHPMDLPQPMVEQQMQARLGQLRTQMAQNGVEEDKIDEHLKTQEDGARQQAERGLQALFIIQAIAEKEDLLVGEKELVEELKSIAERNQASFEEVRDYYQQNQLIDQMALEVLERKVRIFLRESASIEQPR